jgi:hypothetical protein
LWAAASEPPVLFLRLEAISGISAAPYLPDGCCFALSLATEARKPFRLPFF